MLPECMARWRNEKTAAKIPRPGSCQNASNTRIRFMGLLECDVRAQAK
jgi:hypothetical protein